MEQLFKVFYVASLSADTVLCDLFLFVFVEQVIKALIQVFTVQFVV